MKVLFRISFILVLVFTANTIFADENFDKLKTLVGEWEGKTPDGKDAYVKYELISNGTALQEKMGAHGEMEMVSIYHMNGTKLMMTHYCAMNNQPRFEGTASGNAFKFNYLDATNLTDTNAPHITGLVLTIKDADHISQAWSTNNPAMDKGMTVDYTRKK
jgi:hypothetical protein